MSKQTKIKEVIDSLGEVANRDNKISDEEFNILKQVSYDLIQYDKALKSALKDGVITTSERLQLSNLKTQIEKNVVSVADADSKISEDEAMLIKKLSEILRNYL